MRNKIYSERRRKIHSLFNQVLKHSFIAKLIHKNQVNHDLEIDSQTGIYNQFAINSYLKELHPQRALLHKHSKAEFSPIHSNLRHNLGARST
ncbi:hypothetical protein [Acinetobacter bereziniae]|uniref:hypothetical protein n=1 Tax=Acinetobacter bereziniae TaxID=106648 RepID=UPI003AF48B59